MTVRERTPWDTYAVIALGIVGLIAIERTLGADPWGWMAAINAGITPNWLGWMIAVLIAIALHVPFVAAFKMLTRYRWFRRWGRSRSVGGWTLTHAYLLLTLYLFGGVFWHTMRVIA